MQDPKVRVEEFSVSGEKLVATIREIVRQGNVRRIVIRNAKGITLMEIPLVLGIAGAVFVPVWAAIGALAALLVKFTLVIERVEAPPDETADPAGKAAARKAPRRGTPTRKA